jgi:hypothetical protein
MWNNFDILFQRYWEPKTTNIIVSETKSFENDHYITHCPGKLRWGERITKSLDKIDTEYVFFILDDYFLTSSWTEEYITGVIDTMVEYKCDKYLMMDECKLIRYDHIKDNLYSQNNTSQYLTSIQPSIWRTDFLRHAMLDKYSPWDFELKGTQRIRKIDHMILYEKREKGYFNFMRRGGVKTKGWEELFKKENLTIDNV